MVGVCRGLCSLWLCALIAGCGWFGGSDEDGTGGAGGEGAGGDGGLGGTGGDGTGGSGTGGAGMACPDGREFDVSAPELTSSDPESNATVAWTSWLTLRFAQDVDEAVVETFSLCCSDVAVPVSAHRLNDDRSTVVVNPSQDLPFESQCELDWPGPFGVDLLSFSVSPSLPAATVPYDRADASRYAPFPDDVWLTSDPTTPTGVRVELPVPEREQDVESFYGQLKRTAGVTDGFSPIGGLVIELSEVPQESTLPLTPDESLDPLATIGLYDLKNGERVPFQLSTRSVGTLTAPVQHSLVVHPSIPLTPGGTYGFVVTRRALAAGGQPYDPSAFMEAALGPAAAQQSSALADVRPLARDVMTVLQSASPPLFDDDVALVLRFSVRSTSAFPETPLTMKDQVLNGPAPTFEITSAEPGSGDVAAIVEGTWNAPEWRELEADGKRYNIRRDEMGRPEVVGTRPIPFVLAIPALAETEPVPVVMYQHGNPGTAEAGVPQQAERYLAGAGFAVIGFSDTITREVGDSIELQVSAILQAALETGTIPDYWSQTTGEQFSMIRLIQELEALDVVPLGGGDQVPDLDVEAPLAYVGISEGSNKGQALVPYAPEIGAAALVVGAARFGEVLFIQDELLPGGAGTRNLTFLNLLLAPNARALDLFVGWSIFQLGFDPQDGHNHAAFMYRDPLEVAGTDQKPSVLLIEGIHDSRIPNNATRSLAWTLGAVPQLDPVIPVSYLPQASGTVRGNVDPQTTAAHIQYVPAGVPDRVPSVGCEMQEEGHFCAQSASDSIAERLLFFRSAVDDGVPTIGTP